MKVNDELLYLYVPLADQQLLNEIPDQPDPGFLPSRSFRKKMKKLLRQSRYPKLHFHYMSAGRRIAMIVILLFAVSAVLSVGVKAAINFRLKVIEHKEYEDYVEDHYSVEGNGGGIFKKFIYLPPGYELKDEDYSEDSYSGEFMNQEEKQIIFMQVKMSDNITIARDNEFVESHTILLGENEVLIGVTEDGWHECFWTERDIWNVIYAESLSEEEIIKMINGMKE